MTKSQVVATGNNGYERIVEPATRWWADDDDERSEPRVIWSSLTGKVGDGERCAAATDESVVGVVAALVTGPSGGPWSDTQYPVCDGCAGWLLDVDNDASMSGVMDAPVTCGCCTSKSWDEAQWAEFRARMDRIVAAWTLFYGPADEELMAERREWIRDRHAHQPTHLVG